MRNDAHKMVQVLTNTTTDSELWEAAWNGDACRIRELIVLGANTECFNENGNTALHLAIENSNYDAVQVLLEGGAAVNGRTSDEYWTPLLHAVESVSDAAIQMHRSPNNEFIKLLIEYGADVHAKTTRGETALSMAKSVANFEAEPILRAAGAT